MKPNVEFCTKFVLYQRMRLLCSRMVWCFQYQIPNSIAGPPHVLVPDCKELFYKFSLYICRHMISHLLFSVCCRTVILYEPRKCSRIIKKNEYRKSFQFLWWGGVSLKSWIFTPHCCGQLHEKNITLLLKRTDFR